MRYSVKIAFCLIFWPCASQAADDMVEAKKLFARYLEAGSTYNADKMLALINDDMVAYKTTFDADKKETTSRFTATELRAMTRETFPQADANKYKIFYSKINFTPAADGIHVTADTEYYQLCYHDPDYLMIISKGANGSYRIKEEHIRVPSFSYCGKVIL